MICPACDRDNDERRRYCGKCGHNFRPCCRRCAFANDGGDRFCGGCGANLVCEGLPLKPAAAPPPADGIVPMLPQAPVRGLETESAVTQPVAVVALRPAPVLSSVPARPAPPSAPPRPPPAAFVRTRPPTPPTPPPPPHAAPPVNAPPAGVEAFMPTADELAGLFAATAIPANSSAALPASGVSQDDVDRLFGVSP